LCFSNIHKFSVTWNISDVILTFYTKLNVQEEMDDNQEILNVFSDN